MNPMVPVRHIAIPAQSGAFGCAPAGMAFEHALERVLCLVQERLGAEHVPLHACAGRVAAASVAACLNLPAFDQAAMDGYAVDATNLRADAWLSVTGRTAAGEPPGRLTAGGVHRVLTGAPLPEGADAVIAQENVEARNDVVRTAAVPPVGTNVRRRGEDIHIGRPLVPEGTIMDWRHIGVLASQGAGSVLVRRRPRISLLSSGRELRGPGENLAPGQIHDSNLPMLASLLREWGADVHPQPVMLDDRASMRRALEAAGADADVVLTTAGISVGDEDYVRDAVRSLGGGLAVLRVAMKPGKPLAAGRLGRAVFIGLPGNPQAALAGAVGFVRPLLARMMGAVLSDPLLAHAGFDMFRRPGRSEFVLVRLRQRRACVWADRTGPDGSGRLIPLLEASAFAFCPADQGEIHHGAEIRVIPLMSGPIVPTPVASAV
jgi:molybdopterin molybdotransferase